MRSYVRALAVLSATFVLPACPDRTVAKLPPQQQGASLKKIPVSEDIDVLFVIDNSASTLDKQTVFEQNFPAFATALNNFPSGEPNLHIAVVDSTVDIGVTGFGPSCPSPDPADNGLFQNQPKIAGCSPPSGQFISDIKNADGSRTKNYTGTLDQALSCIALLGANGCGFETQLEAMKRALDGTNPQNSGFIRNGAYLAVIFLTDEDDASVKDKTVYTLMDSQVGGRNDFRVQPLFAYNCDKPISASMGDTYSNCTPRTDSYLQDPAFYSQFLSTVKDPGETVVAVIAGPPPGLTTNDMPPQMGTSMTSIMTGSLTINGNVQPMALEPSCSATINGNPAIGRPAVRLASFLSAYGEHGKFYTVCQSDYSAALTDIGNTLFNAISPCLEGPIDTTDQDANNPGTQLQCTVQDVQNIDTPSEHDSPIPPCKMSSPNTVDASSAIPCFWTDQNTTSCPSPDTGYEINIDRGSSPPAPGTVVEVECAITTQM
ncbi:MAG TPA: hypothetical protein VLX92_00060 [Kofleriaceae bacterium]|nr:hypothetical protein [Kofleriaceae bacterium]